VKVPLILLPSFNLSDDNVFKLMKSLINQNNTNFIAIACVDACSKTRVSFEKFAKNNFIPFQFKIFYSKKRLKALHNIVRSLYLCNPAFISWVGIIDGDDYLASVDAVDLIDQEYQAGAKVVWSNFLWDGVPSQLCQSLPKGVDPYSYKWVSSHWRTFSLELFYSVPMENFFDENGCFFPRCYDHALMLPILYICQVNLLATKFLPQNLYYYNNINSSIPASEHTKGYQENKIASYIRSRGFVKSQFV
jgi:hypothetical protein